MDDLIVIILTLIIAGIGILGQIKKKKQESTKTNTQNTPNSLWDVIQGESEYSNQVGNSEFEEAGYDIGQKPEEEQEELYNEKPIYQFKAGNEGQSSINKKLANKIEKPKMKSKFKERFSLRKAVIYSEILNRKYT